MPSGDWPIGIVVGIPVIMGGITQIAKLQVRHRERMAMIERGIHPDMPNNQIRDDPARPV